MPELDLRLDRGRLDRVRHGATVVATTPAVFRVAGPGALACLQGLLTNDLEKPGDGSLVYGALLTPKGMIVVDAWVLRQGDMFTLIVPPSGRAVGGRAVHPPASAPARARDRPHRPGHRRLAGGRARLPGAGQVGRRDAGGGGAGGVGRRGAEPGGGGAGAGVGAVRGAGGGPHAGGGAAGREAGGCGRGGRRGERPARRPAPVGLARPRRRDRRADPAAGSALRRDRRGVVHQGVLHRAGDGGAAPLPRAHQPRAPRPPVDRGRAARRPRRGPRREGRGQRALHPHARGPECSASASCAARSARARPWWPAAAGRPWWRCRSARTRWMGEKHNGPRAGARGPSATVDRLLTWPWCPGPSWSRTSIIALSCAHAHAGVGGGQAPWRRCRRPELRRPSSHHSPPARASRPASWSSSS